MKLLYKILLISFIISLIKTKDFNEYKPVIGIYGNSYPETDFKYANQTVYAGSNIRFLESHGAETMAIHQWYTENELDEILSKVNGVLFIGGSRDFNLSAKWEKNALYIINKAKKTGLPVWGSCQGFQLIIALIANDSSIIKKEYSHSSILDKINKEDLKNSKIFSLFDEKSLNILFNNNSILFDHSFGLSEKDYNENDLLKKDLNITTYANDTKNKKFANTFEPKNQSFNIFGSQFHPETMPFIRSPKWKIENENNVLRMNTLIGSFIVELGRKNKNKFEKKDREKYDFFNLYSNTTNFVNYDSSYNLYYFAKKNKHDDDGKNKINILLILKYVIMGIFIIAILSFLILKCIKLVKKSNNESDYFFTFN